MCFVDGHGYPHACSRPRTWSRANVENEQHGLTSVEIRCHNLPDRTLANGSPCQCSLEHQIVATLRIKLAKMSSVAWQLVATRRLLPHEITWSSRMGHLRRLHLRSENVYEPRSPLKDQGPQGWSRLMLWDFPPWSSVAQKSQHPSL